MQNSFEFTGTWDPILPYQPTEKVNIHFPDGDVFEFSARLVSCTAKKTPLKWWQWLLPWKWFRRTWEVTCTYEFGDKS